MALCERLAVRCTVKFRKQAPNFRLLSSLKTTPYRISTTRGRREGWAEGRWRSEEGKEVYKFYNLSQRAFHRGFLNRKLPFPMKQEDVYLECA